MLTMILFGVEYPKYNDTIAFQPVKEFVRKAMRNQATETIVINRTLFGRFSEETDRTLDFVQPLISQTRAS